MALINVLFYLDKRLQVLILTFLFAACNAGFTVGSVFLGVFFYGYGLALSLVVVTFLAVFMVDFDFKRLEYTTFMLR